MSSKLSQRAQCQTNVPGESSASRSVGSFWTDEQAGEISSGISPTLQTPSSLSTSVQQSSASSGDLRSGCAEASARCVQSQSSSESTDSSSCTVLADETAVYAGCVKSQSVLASDTLLDDEATGCVEHMSTPGSADSSDTLLAEERPSDIVLTNERPLDALRTDERTLDASRTDEGTLDDARTNERTLDDARTNEWTLDDTRTNERTLDSVRTNERPSDVVLTNERPSDPDDECAVAAAAEVADNLVNERTCEHLHKLEQRLVLAQREIQLKDREVDKLNRIRLDIESETVELTASLFQEANKMVLAANEKQAAAEKSLHEASLKIDMLQAEVTALKALVITSTPSRPNTRKHPQLEAPNKSNGMAIFKRGHRRTVSGVDVPRHRGFLDTSPPQTPTLCPPPDWDTTDGGGHKPDLLVEPDHLRELRDWREAPSLDRSHPFIARLHRCDIEPCLQFSRPQLHERLLRAICDNAVFIEALPFGGDSVGGAQAHEASAQGDSVKQGSDSSPRCSLLDGDLSCSHRIRLPGDEWLPISQLCRNRVIAVCECVNYLRYIQLGLVKASNKDVFRRIAGLRRNMALARLGFPIRSDT